MERQIGVPSLHKAFHEHPWKGRRERSLYLRLSDGKINGCDSLYLRLSIKEDGRADACAFPNSDFRMERQMGALSLRILLKDTWKGRWVCFSYLRLSNEKADGCALLTQGFPQTPMEGLVGVLSICQALRWKGRC